MRCLVGLFLLLVTSCELLNAQQPTLSSSPAIVDEGDSVRACVTYQTLPATEVSVMLSTRDGGVGGAKGGSDFEALVETLVFGPTSQLEQCRDINILVDSTLENVQIFEIIAVIDGETEGISGSPQNPIIQSFDSITVGFGQASYSFNEDEGGQMCVVIEEGAIETTQGIELSFTSTDGSAETEADSDYNAGVISSAIMVTLNSDTPAAGECFDVPITPDTQVESDETFTISISSNPSVVLNPATSQATVTIVNDDAACVPPSLENGDFTVNGTTPSMRGDTATYTCSAGYELVGDSVLTCQLGDVWSPTAPGTCSIICPELSLIENGGVSPRQGVEGDVATYTCDEGFIVVGEAERTCQANGEWSGSEPTCTEAATCPELSLIENGDVSPLQGVEGDVATYTCDEGFMVVGEAERTCEADGEWSGMEPVCNGAPKSVLPTGLFLLLLIALLSTLFGRLH